MDTPSTSSSPPTDAARLAALEARLARLEAHLGIDGRGAPAPVEDEAAPAALRPVELGPSEEALEFAVGQSGFAIAGIVVLTLGAASLLALPFPGTSAVVPPLAGYLTAAAIFALAHAGRRSFELAARYLRGAAMAILFLATLRLSFPAAHHLLSVDSAIVRLLLVGVVGLNLWIALRQKSAGLTAIALAAGAVTLALAHAAWFQFGGLVLLAMAATFVTERNSWAVLRLVVVAGATATYAAWALAPGATGGSPFAPMPAIAPAILLSCTLVFASVTLWRPRLTTETAWDAVHALSVCAFGYAFFFAHTVASYAADLAVWHAAACAMFLGLAIAFWVRQRSRAATFFYAMTGYAGLSVAILKLAPAPAVFVWLSMQSVVVVATATWFRSRFIVVANFLIYVGIVLVYMFATERETGISLGFGVVALVTARILHWQQDRLELKTTLMRNAYLLSAFVVFPYALYHLVPARQVALAWVGLALGYYGLHFLIKNQKYRWMGHATLLLTTCYLVVVATSRFEPAYRVLSFLVLGAALLGVSLAFTRGRKQPPPVGHV
jgi:hypothetical protein